MRDVVVETKNSSTLRLLCEMTRWDEVEHYNELDVIAKEIRRRLSLNKASIFIFFICFIMSNLGSAFSEHFYVFDEDEKEIRRKLKNDILNHLTILILLSCFSFFIQAGLTLAILTLYILWTTKTAIYWYRPLHKILKSICT